MSEKTLKEFIEKNATEKNLCYEYKSYSKEVQESLQNIYLACFRFGLYKSQTLFVLDDAIRPFKLKKKMKEIEDMFDL